jgi:hypothetical protein
MTGQYLFRMRPASDLPEDDWEDTDDLVVWSCLTPVAKGMRPKACHGERRRVDMEGDSSDVTEATFYYSFCQ